MNITVFIERNNEIKHVYVGSINEIFEKLNIDRNVVLITRNNELLNGDEKLRENDEIKLLSVISGG